MTDLEQLRQRLLGTEAGPAATGLSRLWKTGRSAAGLAGAVLGGRLRGESARGLASADTEAVVRLVERLGELKGVAMKAGQILGYVDPSLPPELRGVLSLLQTASPATPWPQVEAALRATLGARADALVAGLERAPVAVASIGQVHRGAVEGAEVAVKVRHPGIEAALRSDFAAAGVGGAIAASVFRVAGASVESFVDEARTAFLEECDYRLESDRQAEFARLFADDETVVVPPVLPAWCGADVLTTGWRPGRPLEAWLAGAPAAEARDRVGEALFRFYVGTLYRHGIFHADPHPGNYGFRDDGRVVVYDFGCVRRFEPPIVRAFAALLRAVKADEGAAMADALLALGARPRPAVSAHLRQLLRGFFGPLMTPGPRTIPPDQGVEARQIMEDKRAIMQLALPGRLLFLFRLRFGLYAVLSRVGAVADWAALESRWADEVMLGGGSESAAT